MKYHFSPQSDISPSATLQMNTAAATLRATGITVHNLSVGEAILPTDSVIIEAAKAALDADYTNYLPEAGLPELRDLMAEWMNQTYYTSYTRAHTTITAGGKHGLLLLLQTLVSPGDEVVFQSPYWVSYPSMVHVVGGVSVVIPTTEADDWKLSPAALLAAITDRTRVLILNSAANPTGTVYTDTELDQLLMIAQAHNIIVISDEVYSTLVYDRMFASCGALHAYEDIVCIVQSVSKHVGMTGWRVGAVFAPEPISSRVQTLQGQSTSGASSIAQYAACAAVTHMDRISTTVRQTLELRRDIVVSTLSAYGIKIQPAASGLYQFVPIAAFGGEHIPSLEWCEYQLQKKHVATVPGVAFGAEGYIRLSFGGTDTTIRQAITALCSN